MRRVAKADVGGIFRYVDLLKNVPDDPDLLRVWHYEDNTLLPPWSEIHSLRTDQWSIVTSPVFPGTSRSAEFNVKPGDTGWQGTSGTLRSEVRASIAESGSPTEGTVQWWAWPTYFRADFNWDEANQFLIWTQFHHTNNAGQPNIALWSDDREHFMLDVRGGTGGLTSGDAQFSKVYDLGLLNLGAWNDILMHVKWSSDPAIGYVEIWRDGTLLHSASDATLYVDQSIYIKQGIYSAAGTTLQHFIAQGPLRLGKTRAAVENLPFLT
jgi:hypothetical protein